jgi:hypothetical protein
MENDFRLVAARRLVWNKERCLLEPAYRALVIHSLEEMGSNEDWDPTTQAEIAMLTKKLYAAGKPSPLT